MELDKANEMHDALTDVRVLSLPPFTVASIRVAGAAPEKDAGDIMEKFVRESHLYSIKPDSRMFGFNNPSPTEYGGAHGYEIWVTIPDDMELPKPFEKKRFAGGLYAAHTIDFPNFHEWESLLRWARESKTYAEHFDARGGERMEGCLEEHLHWVYTCDAGLRESCTEMQIDLLLPIAKRREL